MYHNIFLLKQKISPLMKLGDLLARAHTYFLYNYYACMAQ